MAQEYHPVTGLEVLHLGSDLSNDTCRLLTEKRAACVDATGSDAHILIRFVSTGYFGEG